MVDEKRQINTLCNSIQKNVPSRLRSAYWGPVFIEDFTISLDKTSVTIKSDTASHDAISTDLTLIYKLIKSLNINLIS